MERLANRVNPNRSNHGQAEVKQGRPSKRVGEAVDELRQHGRDPLAQEKVGDDSNNHHEHDGVLKYLEKKRE